MKTDRAAPLSGKPLAEAPLAEFSPAMLALFLEARIVSRMVWRHGVPASGLPLKGGAENRTAERKAFFKELATVSRVPAGTLDLARKGRVHAAMTRAKIWGGLGIVPADRGVMLLDNGGQEQVG